MAIVEVMRVPWEPKDTAGNSLGSGHLSVFADNAGNRAVDRIEIDNSQCRAFSRVRVRDQDVQWNFVTLIDVTLEPNAPLQVHRTQNQGGPIPNNDRWREGAKGLNPVASKYIVQVGNWE